MAATFSGVVYDPPRPDLPYLAVIFKPEGEVLTALAVASVEAGEALIKKTLLDFKKKVDAETKGKR